MDNRDKILKFSGYVLAVKVAFEEKLQSKTGWGRNEVIELFEKAHSETLAKLLDLYVK